MDKLISFLKTRLGAAMAIAIVATLWLFSGGGGNELERSAVAARAIEVSTETVSAAPYRQEVKLVARIEPQRLVSVAAEVAGPIKAVLTTEGDTLAAQTPMLQIDDAEIRAAVTTAEANRDAAATRLQTALRLQKDGLSSAISVADRRAELAAAEERLTQAQENLIATQPRSPFAGRVERVHVEAGDFVSIGAPLVTYLDTTEFLAVGFASQDERLVLVPLAASDASAKIGVDQAVEIFFPQGKKVPAKLRFIAQAADEQTNTYRVEAVIEGDALPQISTGLSVDLTIPAPQEVTAHRIPHAALVLDEDGKLGVMAADEGRAKFMPVEQLGDTPDSLWVAGLPTRIELIVRGQNNVSNGSDIQVNTPDA